MQSEEQQLWNTQECLLTVASLCSPLIYRVGVLQEGQDCTELANIPDDDGVDNDLGTASANSWLSPYLQLGSSCQPLGCSSADAA